MPNRSRPLRRRPPKLKPKPRLLIICEGRVTEPSYFRGLKSEEQVRAVEVIVDDEGGTPKTLVERAARRMKAARRAAKGARDQNLRYDEIWCVFDVDEHPKLNDANQQAKANNISIAASNPCFELWLLLHFRDQRAWIHRHDAQRACTDFIRDFEKEINFSEIRERVEDAIKRAIELQRWQESRGCPDDNPSTNVYRLVQRLKELSKSMSLKEIQSVQVLGNGS